MKVRDWLLDPDGGDVPQENLALLLSPLPRRRRPAGTPTATKDNITTAIADLVVRSGGQGERLFFYYAGHGLTARVDFSDEPTLVAADFTDVLTDNSIALRSLWEFFEASEFADQFFFVDACRNPWSGELVVGRWTLPQTRRPGQEPVQQFVLYATSPGLRALELREPGDERGAFTEALLQGLSGDGVAKAWSADDRYVVRWESLANYVKGDFEHKLLSAGDGFQIPQSIGKSGVIGRERNPVLASFPAGDFKGEDLHVYLEPAVVASSAEVSVIDRDAGEPCASQSQPAELPVSFTLPPKTYGLRAKAPDHADAIARPPIDLYGPTDVTLSLTPLARARRPTAARSHRGRARMRRAAGVVPRAASATRAKAAIAAWSSDPLATIEVADSADALIAVGTGRVDLEGLQPGFFRVRLRSPEGEVHERTVELTAGGREQLHLFAPPRPESKAVERLVEDGLPEAPDNTLTVAESVGPMASPHLSTILTVAAGLHLRGETGGRSLAVLRMDALSRVVSPAAASAVYVLFGIDARSAKSARNRLGRTKIRLWHFGEEIPSQAEAPEPFSGSDGLGEFARETAVGPHWLAIALPGGRTMVFAIACLPRRLTMLVLQQDLLRDVSVYQYLPALRRRDESSEPTFLRRLELMQRVYLGNRLDLGHKSAVELLRGKSTDPLAGCLGGYLLLRLGEGRRLGNAVRNMTTLYPELSDSHVLRAEYEAVRGRDDAAARWAARAIEAGIPIFTEGVSHLLDALGEYRIDHPNGRLLSKLFDYRMQNSLWSGWTPGRLPLGRLLVP